MMCTDEGGFHWMGWESGCFPASVIITWTGLWPSEEREVKEESHDKNMKDKDACTASKIYDMAVLHL